MTCIKQVGFLAGAAALTLTSVGYANPGSVDLQDRLAQAEAKIAELEAKQSDNWMTEQRADEIRGLVQDVLADADTRANLLGSGMTGGYDNGAVLGSDDGNFLLRTNIIMQQRFIYNSQDDNAGASNDTNRSGFENTRTAFNLSGHVVNPNFLYDIRINVGNNTGGTGRTNLQHAWLGYRYNDQMTIRMGTMKDAFLREELVNAENQLAVERSLLNYAFTTGYTTGLAVDYNLTDDLHFTAAYTNGANSGNGTALAADTEYALSARAEYKLSGNWDQFSDFTSPMGSEQGMMIGVAFATEKNEFGAGLPALKLETTRFTVDFSAEFDGANVFAAFMLADFSDSGSAVTDGSSPVGFLVQGGYYLNEDWELFGRYEFLDYDTVATTEDMSVLTFGVTRYYSGNNAKWTTDVGIGVNEVMAAGAPFPAPNGITGFRTDTSAGQDSQLVLRTQWQIVF